MTPAVGRQRAAPAQVAPEPAPVAKPAPAPVAGGSLPDAMRPQRLHVVTAIPRLPSAKPDVAGLRELDLTRRKAAPADDRAATLDDDDAGRIVAQAWLDTLGTLGGSANPTWSEAGGDSLRLLEFVLRIERAIQRPVPLEHLDIDIRLDAVTALIASLPKTCSEAADQDARPTVFFFPGIEDDSVAQARFRQGLGDTASFEAITGRPLSGREVAWSTSSTSPAPTSSSSRRVSRYVSRATPSALSWRLPWPRVSLRQTVLSPGSRCSTPTLRRSRSHRNTSPGPGPVE